MNNNIPFWIMLAREGETTDGRHISAETLIALAKNYSTEIMQIQVRIGYGLKLHAIAGGVLAAKTEVENDKVCLYILMQPNAQYLDTITNAEQQRIPLYPCMAYYDHLVGIDSPYLYDVMLCRETVIKNLEPLNKHMVKS
ncbi:Phage capsid scaffolding protein (GPO) serine peptidase [compost metagenome]